MQLPYGISAEVVELLREAAREIARLDGPDNDVCRRLKALQERIVPLSTTIGELAGRVDASARDVFDAALAIGVRTFWHEGAQFRDPEQLQAYLRQPSHWDQVPELEIDLSLGMAQRLAEELGVERDELFLTAETTETAASTGRTLRKFIASESKLPAVSQGNRSERTG